MTELPESTGGTEKRPITKRDLYQFFAGKCDDDMRELIAHQRTLIGSPVQKWFAEMQEKCADPFNIDWGKLAFEPMEKDQDDDANDCQRIREKAISAWQSGDKETSIRLCKEAAAIAEKRLPHSNPNWRQSWVQLAYTYQAIGRFDDAIAAYEQLLNVARHILGYSYENVTDIQFILQICNYPKDNEKILSYLDELADVLKKLSTIVDPEKCDAAILQAYVKCVDIGDWKRLVQWGHSLHVFREQRFGKSHPEVGAALHLLAAAHRFDNDRELAEMLLRRALEIPDNPSHIIVMNDLGAILGDTERFYEAIDILEQALELAKAENNNNLALIYNNLGSMHFSLGNYIEAEEYLGQSVDLNLAEYGREDSRSSMSMNNYACISYYANRTDIAVEFLEMASYALENSSPLFAVDCAVVKHNMSVILKTMGDSQWETMFENAQALWETAMQDDNVSDWDTQRRRLIHSPSGSQLVMLAMV